MKPLKRCLFVFLLALSASLAQGAQITVSAAVSLRDAVTEIAGNFTKEQGVEVKFIFGGSGKLAEQIKAGSPVDLFVSASIRQMDDLATFGLIDPDSGRIIAGNALVLIVPAGGKTNIDGYTALGRLTADQRIAIGNPNSVPAGQYAREILVHLKIWDSIKGNLVYGANVRQVLDYVERGEVEAGVVYSTDALVSGDKVIKIAVADPATHSPIIYPAVVLRDAVDKATAERFLDYLLTKPSQEILTRHGFIPPDTAKPDQ